MTLGACRSIMHKRGLTMRTLEESSIVLDHVSREVLTVVAMKMAGF
jgi:hypothetical protein